MTTMLIRAPFKKRSEMNQAERTADNLRLRHRKKRRARPGGPTTSELYERAWLLAERIERNLSNPIYTLSVIGDYRYMTAIGWTLGEAWTITDERLVL